VKGYYIAGEDFSRIVIDESGPAPIVRIAWYSAGPNPEFRAKHTISFDEQAVGVRSREEHSNLWDYKAVNDGHLWLFSLVLWQEIVQRVRSRLVEATGSVNDGT
jgi:hypothetical protein